MNPARKRIAWLIVAVGGALLVERVVALSSDDATVSEPVQRVRAAPVADRDAPPAPAPTALRLQRLDARAAASSVEGEDRIASAGGLPFDAQSWQPPAPKVVPPPAPPPAAPPFPYAYMGGLSEDGVRTVFFARGDRALPLKDGDTVDATWRVDQINDRQMTLTYLPLEQTVNVPIGGAR